MNFLYKLYNRFSHKIFKTKNTSKKNVSKNALKSRKINGGYTAAEILLQKILTM
ncbi:hypothetical protein QJU73_06025 [Pasteurella atlantica]|uniref:hypothetical protein n=1 Tax=Phocoenobacter atlanticus TaxID=3416742 RepID=UPI0027508275|nr:hypothetical protein [Pasteurella atlantica]MDP8142533.1 hypothetical protein [Pasteurella atlantica]MDP8164695.1 hypothetical protein [Pasteurella atlantica]MDP8193557.1 hypothetical protein [Pasteurella atlantica]